MQRSTDVEFSLFISSLYSGCYIFMFCLFQNINLLVSVDTYFILQCIPSDLSEERNSLKQEVHFLYSVMYMQCSTFKGQ